MTERIPGEVQPTSPIGYIADMLCCAQINKKKPEGLIVAACVVEIIGPPSLYMLWLTFLD